MTLKHLRRYTILSLLLFIISSCSLVKIESEQTPLGIRELNTRLLTQNFARNAMDRVESAADSIFNLSMDQNKIQLNSIRWKIETLEELGKISFQTEPKIALLDTWAYFLEVKILLETSLFDHFFGPYRTVALGVTTKNIEEIENIALKVLPNDEFIKNKDFVQTYAKSNSSLSQNEFKHQSLRDSYLKFKKIPDSIAFQTVGTLAEVLSNASNHFGYFSDASSKRFSWKADMILKKNGLDSVSFQEKLTEFETQFDRLLTVAEKSPENIDLAIKEFRNNISPLFSNLNEEISSAIQSLSSNIVSIDTIFMRERVALDSIIKRERAALITKADNLVENGIENTFKGLERIVRKLILYFILLFVIVLGLPFYLGYLTGKRKSKSK